MEETIIATLGIENPFTQDQVREGVAKWPKSLDTCLKRFNTFNSLQLAVKSANSDTADTFQSLAKDVKVLEPLLRPSTDVEKEGYSQICFQGTPWSSINSIPFALVILSIFKSYIVPAFSIVLPLLS